MPGLLLIFLTLLSPKELFEEHQLRNALLPFLSPFTVSHDSLMLHGNIFQEWNLVAFAYLERLKWNARQALFSGMQLCGTSVHETPPKTQI